MPLQRNHTKVPQGTKREKQLEEQESPEAFTLTAAVKTSNIIYSYVYTRLRRLPLYEQNISYSVLSILVCDTEYENDQGPPSQCATEKNDLF